MKKRFYLSALFMLFVLACSKRTDQDQAIELVKSKYQSADQKLNFEDASLDSLYNISPKAYADSIRRGKELDSVLAVLESQIEHLNQQESDSVGLISAALTKQRYKLLELEKTKPQFIGWKLTGVRIKGVKREILSFRFNKDITQITE